MQYAVCGTVEYVQSIIGKHPELSVVPVLFYIEENVVCHVLVFVHVRAVPVSYTHLPDVSGAVAAKVPDAVVRGQG